MKRMMMAAVMVMAVGAGIAWGWSYNPEVFTIESNFTGQGATEGYFTAGGYVVWWSTPSLELTGYDLAKRESFAVAPAGNVDAVSPRMNESYFVWRDSTANQLYAFDLAKRECITAGPGNMDGSTLVLTDRYLCWLGTTDQTLYGFDLMTRESFTIASGNIDTLSIRGAGNYLVYRTQTNPSWYGYDLAKREGFLIYADGMNSTFNTMNGQAVILSSGPFGNLWLQGFDLDERQTFTIVEGDWTTVFSIQGDTILWSGYFMYPGLWAYSIGTGRSFQVTTESVGPQSTKVNERYVVWTGYDAESNMLVYGHDLLKRKTIDTGVEPGNASLLLADSFFYWEFSNSDMTVTEFHGYDLMTGTEFSVAPVSNGGIHTPKTNGDYLFWADSTQPGTNPQLFAARIWKLPNDLCEDAEEVAEGTAYRGDSSGATGTDLTDCGSDDRRDVWHLFRAGEDGEYTIDAGSAAFDTTLAVFGGCAGDAILACNDNRNSQTSDSRLAMTLTKGQWILIRVAGAEGSSGPYELTVSHGPCAMRPQADLNGDCTVNLPDLAILAQEWLTNTK